MVMQGRDRKKRLESGGGRRTTCAMDELSVSAASWASYHRPGSTRSISLDNLCMHKFRSLSFSTSCLCSGATAPDVPGPSASSGDFHL